jgi:hypothetical protein
MSLNPSTETDRASATETPKTGTSFHSGHSLEAGVLARSRSWIDVFGWIRLGRVLRVASSPTLLLLVAVTTGVWLGGLNVFVGAYDEANPSLLLATDAENDTATKLLTGAILIKDVFRSMFLPEVFERSATHSVFTLAIRSLWSIIVWAPCAMVLVRQGALLTAGRSMQPIGDVSRWVTRRLRNSYLSALMPSLSVLSLYWVVPVIYWGSSLIGFVFVDWLLSLVLVGLAIPIGMLAFGSLFAIPLSWAAIMNEREPDTLDSLSRGYEYLYRRPLRLFGYTIVAIVILAAVNILATLVVGCGGRMVADTVNTNGGGNTLAASVWFTLGYVPAVVTYTVSWSLIGGIYLLLRQDAGGQEVEDLWIESAQPAVTLPELKQ